MPKYKLWVASDANAGLRLYYRAGLDYTQDEEEADVLDFYELMAAIESLKGEITDMAHWDTVAFNILRVS